MNLGEKYIVKVYGSTDGVLEENILNEHLK